MPAEAQVAVPATLVEGALWLTLLGFAVALRLAALDHLPLSVGESARSFDAWLVAKGKVPDGWSGDLTAALTSHLFRIFGSSETVARVVPAVGGSGMIAAFWFARRYLGLGVALLAAIFVAYSPVAVYASRSAFGFATGGFLSMVMVVSLLAYLTERRPAQAAVLAGSFGLALTSDPIAVSTAAALVVFLAVEAAWRPGGAVAQAATAFRSSGEQWQPAAVTLAAALLLGFLQFGTDVDRLSLAGVSQWLDMFTLPRDSLPWHYQFDVLLGYEWPLLLAGGAAFVLVLGRWLASGETPSVVQRLLVTWAGVGLLVALFATRRESGQLLALLLPFAFLAAALLEDTASRVDWSLLKRWWPAAGLALGLTAYGMFQLSRWAREGGHISGGERVYLVVALFAAAAIVIGGFVYLGRNGLAVALPVAAALALPFLVHSSLSLGTGGGSEFAAVARITSQMEPFRAAIAQAATQTGQSVAIDPSLRDELGWYLRHSPVAFGDPPAGAAAVLPAGEPSPAGQAPLGGPWLLAQGWAIRHFDALLTWRWFAYRQPYGNLSNTDVQILVPSP
ncbi:MAG TPA: glycosyltransferase family 39 protein [Dehalococcoidia bacterium]|nr:glycosyltransferase family 39 protein [Dehalococcoidia bacterium]